MNKFNWREKENKSQRPCRWKMKLPLMFEPNINSQYEICVRFIRDSLLKTVFYALTFISQIKNSNIVVMCWLIDRFVDMFSGCGSIILGVCTCWSGVITSSSVVNNQLKLNMVIIEFKGSGGMVGLKEFELNPNKQELTCHVIWSYSKHTQMSLWPKLDHDEWNYHCLLSFQK